MLSNGLDYASAASHVNMPHPASVHDPGARRIDYECQMNNSFRTISAQQLQKLVAGAFLGQIRFFEMGKRRSIFRRMYVHSHHMKIGELFKHTESQFS